MPESSIVIKATDKFSDAMKTMSASAKTFKNDLGGMQSKLNALNRTKATLKVDTDKARAELKNAEKQFEATGEASALSYLRLAAPAVVNGIASLSVF